MANWGNPGNPTLKQAIPNGMIPSEGPKTLPIKVDLTVNTSALIDFSQQNELKQISFIQGVFVDNSGNSASVSIICEGTNQFVEVSAGAQGYIPLLATLPNKFLVASMGGVIVPLFFYNVPMPAAVWGEGVAPFSFDVNGNLEVADQNLAPLINNRDGSNNALDVNVLYGGGSSATSGLPSISGTTTATSGINNVTMFAPGVGNKFRLSGFVLYASANLAENSENSQVRSWQVVQNTYAAPTVTIFRGDHFVPAILPAMGSIRDGAMVELFRSPPGMLFESSVAGQNLTFNPPVLSSGLDTGAYYWTVCVEAFV